MGSVVVKYFTCALIAISINGCGGGSSSTASSSIVVNDTQTVGEGVQISYTLNAGLYDAQITSSNNGVKISWQGGSCNNSGEVKNYSASCNLTIKGQLIIENPTVLGLGGSEIVTIKVTRSN